MNAVRPLRWRRLLAFLDVAIVIIALAAVPAAQASHGAYTVVELAPGSPSVGALDVNNEGQVVGVFQDTEGVVHGFLYDSGSVSDVSGSSGFIPRAINDQGEMAGTIQVVVDGSNATHAAFRATSGAVSDLGTLGGPSSVALDLNEHGRVIGYSEIEEGRERAFLFDGSQMLQIGPLGSSIPRVHATSINDQGQVVGFDDRGDFGRSEAFLYENGTTTLLPRDEDAQGMFASGINDSSVTSGWMDRYYGTLITGSPMRWRGDELERLGSYGRTAAINCRGEAVGTHASALGTPQLAVLFSESGIVDLIQELPTSDPAEAFAISDEGHIVVNQASSDGFTSHAYLLTPTASAPDCPQLTGETEASFEASADTYLRSGVPNTNEGRSTFLRLRANGDNRALVRFDQSAITNAVGSGTLISATLELEISDNGNNWGANGRTISAYRLTSDWAEGNGFVDQGPPPDRGSGEGATWACAVDSDISDQGKDCSTETEWEMGKPNQPELHPWVEPASASALIQNGQTGTVTFDVTTDVGAFLSGTANFGWILKKDLEGQPGDVRFASRQTINGPRLVLVMAGGGSSLALLQRYVPELRYDSDDTFRAVSAATMTDNYQPSYSNVLQRPFGPIFAYSDPKLSADDLSIGYLGRSYPPGGAGDGRLADSIDEIDAANSYEVDGERLGGNPRYANKVYGRIFEEQDGTTILQYWFFYYFNWHPRATAVGDHEGDWEMVQVRLDPDGTPADATFAQHRAGETCEWSQVEKTADGRPVVYVARGSHASYYTPGDKPITDDAPFGDFVNGDAEPVTPSVIEINAPAPAWLQWPGRWGSSLSSPNGPAFKGDQWLNPMSWGANQRGCWERSSLRTTERTERQARIPAPVIVARVQGTRVTVSYSFLQWPLEKRTQPTRLHVAVHSSDRQLPPLVFRYRIARRSGVIRQPLGMGRGPFEVSSIAYSPSGSSARVSVHATR